MSQLKKLDHLQAEGKGMTGGSGVGLRGHQVWRGEDGEELKELGCQKICREWFSVL